MENRVVNPNSRLRAIVRKAKADKSLTWVRLVPEKLLIRFLAFCLIELSKQVEERPSLVNQTSRNIELLTKLALLITSMKIPTDNDRVH